MTAACPRCGNVDCASNAFPNVPVSKITDRIFTERQPGWLRQALSELMLWAGINAANRIRAACKCNHCGLTYG